MSAAPTVRIAETFTSIQGEGKLTGTRSFFIRVSGCNLRCGWCDTSYTSWDPEGESRSIDSLVEEAKGSGARHAVLTGGEPMMFPQIEPLAESVRSSGLHVTIETAGTIFRSVACDLMSISPKLANSTPRAGDPRDPGGVWRQRHEERRLNLGALQQLIDAYAQRQLKFVVAGPGDLAEIQSLLARLSGWSEGDILLMPEGITVPRPETRDWIERECATRGWTYCPRLHIELFGHRRGT